jgi:hypothetical protein
VKIVEGVFVYLKFYFSFDILCLVKLNC